MVTSISISRSDFREQSDKKDLVKTVQQSMLDSKDQSNGYNFRNRRRAAEDIIGPPAKRQRTLVVPNQIKPKLIVAKKELLSEGLIVLAQMRTYAAWPAKIQTFGKTCVNVYFFGDETSGNVPFGSIGLFKENDQLIISNLRQNKARYEKAVRHAELVMKIPNHLSLLNQM